MSQQPFRSAQLFARAQRLFPGGVNSPVRGFGSVGGTPRFIQRGYGARIVDEDGNELIDYVMSWGALALGHAPQAVRDAVSAQLARGTTFGAPTEVESELASLIISAMPSLELIRFVSSGTEAVMSALRLARAATGRPKVIKFSGCYHGHADSVLAAAGSGVATLRPPDSPGVTAATSSELLVAPYNDAAAVERLFGSYPAGVAAVIVEPVAANMGLVQPLPGFLTALRDLTSAHGALLVFDEVVTGFRVGWGGAQGRFSVTPDLTCLGKIIGGGLPAAAFGGRADLMERVAPAGPVYQAGTLSGNPLAMAAGVATLSELSRDGTYEQLSNMATSLSATLAECANDAGIAAQTTALGGLWGVFFSDCVVRDFDTARTSDGARYARYFHAMLEAGVYLPPSPFEACFVSTAHGRAELQHTLAAFVDAIECLTKPSHL